MDDFNMFLNGQLTDADLKLNGKKAMQNSKLQNLFYNARIQPNLTQSQFAQLSGIPQSNISRLENGGAIPT